MSNRALFLRMSRFLLANGGLALALAFAGCTSGGDGDGDDDGEGTDGGNTISHAVDIQPIWDANCQGPDDDCHRTGGKWTTPRLNEEDAYDSLVGQLATQPLVMGVQMNYIEPNDVANSYLVHKLEGTHTGTPMGNGEQMPCDTIEMDLSCSGNSSMLSAADVQAIKDWINDGAGE